MINGKGSIPSSSHLGPSKASLLKFPITASPIQSKTLVSLGAVSIGIQPGDSVSVALT
jgi:hypothetical protein